MCLISVTSIQLRYDLLKHNSAMATCTVSSKVVATCDLVYFDPDIIREISDTKLLKGNRIVLESWELGQFGDFFVF